MQLLLSSYVISISLLLLLLIFMGPSQNNSNFVVAQERMVRYLFNNGIPPSSSQTCTWQDNQLIDEIFRYRYARRYLRNNNGDDNDLADDNDIMDVKAFVAAHNYSWAPPANDATNHIESAVVAQHRDLAFPKYCKDNCAGYVQGCCKATNCVGYRRRELKSENKNGQHNDDRNLQVASCNTVMTAIQNKINDLVWNNKVSSTCKSYLTAPIIKTCTDDVVYGVLEGIKFWDVGNPSAPTLMATFNANSMPLSTSGIPASSFSFCRSRKITIEAIMNPCVMVTSFHMYHNQNWWSPAHINNQQTALPFSLYGNSGSQMNGMQWLNVGTYVVDIKPDWWIWKEKRFVFTVNNC